MQHLNSHVQQRKWNVITPKNLVLNVPIRSIFGYLIMCSFISWKNSSIGWNDEWIESLTGKKSLTHFSQQQQRKNLGLTLYVLFRFTFRCICLTERDFFGSLSTRMFFCSRVHVQFKRRRIEADTKTISMQSNNFPTLFDKFKHFSSFVRWAHLAAFSCYWFQVSGCWCGRMQ